MKRLFAILIAITLLIPSVAFAKTDFSEISDEELLELEAEIKAEKSVRGLPKSALLIQGRYSIGERGDIPAGRYIVVYEYSNQITSFPSKDYYWLVINLKDSEGKTLLNMELTSEHSDHPSIYIDFPEGSFLTIENDAAVRLVKSEGIIFE